MTNNIFKMSFYYSQGDEKYGYIKFDRKLMLETISNTTRPIYYRYGFAYRGAELRPIIINEAIKIINKNGLLDFEANTSEIILNEYSENDMF